MLCYLVSSSSSEEESLLSEESSADHACFFVVSDSESDSELSDAMRGEKFLMMSAKDSLTGDYSGEGDPRAVVVTMLLTNGVGCRS